jgi:hypothetical protein
MRIGAPHYKLTVCHCERNAVKRGNLSLAARIIDFTNPGLQERLPRFSALRSQ